MSLTAIGALVVFATAYVLIATEKLNRSLVALGGAAAMVAIGAMRGEDIFFSEETGVDWNVVFLLFGMMVIVGALRQTGIFEYVAIWSAQRARARPFRVMVMLVLITAAASALLDNVTTVLLIAPVTLLVCDRLGVDPVPFLLAEVFSSNIGGTATLIGDPPNIIIASRSGLSFNDFLVNLVPVVVIMLAFFVGLCWLLWGRRMRFDPERADALMALTPGELVTDRTLLVRLGGVLALVLLGFVTHSVTHLEPSLVALLGAGAAVLLANRGYEVRDYMQEVEWETLLFFAGLFIMVGALVKEGVIGELSTAATNAIGDNFLPASLGFLLGSAVLSGVVDNIPYVATMAPLVLDTVGAADGLPPEQVSLWWSLALGADLGGNLTAIGASANVIVVGIAARNGHPISFWHFTRYGVIVTAMTMAVAAPYIVLRYFVLA